MTIVPKMRRVVIQTLLRPLICVLVLGPGTLVTPAQAQSVGLQRYLNDCIAWLDSGGSRAFGKEWFTINPPFEFDWGDSQLYHNRDYAYEMVATRVTVPKLPRSMRL